MTGVIRFQGISSTGEATHEASFALGRTRPYQTYTLTCIESGSTRSFSKRDAFETCAREERITHWRVGHQPSRLWLAYHTLPIDYSPLPWVENHFDADAFLGFVEQYQDGANHSELARHCNISPRLVGRLLKDIQDALETS